MPAALPELVVADAAALDAWLGEHGGTSAGVLLVLAKKGTSSPTTLRYPEAVEAALCHGWIDGQAGRRDEGTYTVRYTPRRPRSLWSQRNTGLVERLVAEGRMRPGGLAEVERAQADGRWQAAYAGPASMEVPDELAAALAAAPRALAAFEALGRSDRYAVLFRVTTAVRPEARARLAAQFAERLAAGLPPLTG